MEALQGNYWVFHCIKIGQLNAGQMKVNTNSQSLNYNKTCQIKLKTENNVIVKV